MFWKTHRGCGGLVLEPNSTGLWKLLAKQQAQGRRWGSHVIHLLAGHSALGPPRPSEASPGDSALPELSVNR